MRRFVQVFICCVFDHCMCTLQCPFDEGVQEQRGGVPEWEKLWYMLLPILNVVMLCRNTRVLRLREVRDQWVKVLAVCTLEHENFEKWSCC